jgi:hypothetical protein
MTFHYMLLRRCYLGAIFDSETARMGIWYTGLVTATLERIPWEGNEQHSPMAQSNDGCHEDRPISL